MRKLARRHRMGLGMRRIHANDALERLQRLRTSGLLGQRHSESKVRIGVRRSQHEHLPEALLGARMVTEHGQRRRQVVGRLRKRLLGACPIAVINPLAPGFPSGEGFLQLARHSGRSVEIRSER